MLSLYCFTVMLVLLFLVLIESDIDVFYRVVQVSHDSGRALGYDQFGDFRGERAVMFCCSG